MKEVDIIYENLEKVVNNVCLSVSSCQERVSRGKYTPIEIRSDMYLDLMLTMASALATCTSRVDELEYEQIGRNPENLDSTLAIKGKIAGAVAKLNALIVLAAGEPAQTADGLVRRIYQERVDRSYALADQTKENSDE